MEEPDIFSEMPRSGNPLFPPHSDPAVRVPKITGHGFPDVIREEREREEKCNSGAAVLQSELDMGAGRERVELLKYQESRRLIVSTHSFTCVCYFH